MIAWIADTLGPWTWWVVGLLLLGLEILAPGTFFLWFGLAALVVGAISLFVVWSWQLQVITFVVLALVLLLIGRRVLRSRQDSDNGGPALNQRAARYIGRTFVLKEPIVEGEGKLHIDDTIWRIHGPDSPAGTRVNIVRAEGARLIVDKKSDN